MFHQQAAISNRPPAHPRPRTWLTRSCAPGPSPMSTLPLSSPPQFPAALSTSTCGNGRSHSAADGTCLSKITSLHTVNLLVQKLIPPQCRPVYEAMCSLPLVCYMAGASM